MLPTEESGNGVDKLCPPKEADISSPRRSYFRPRGAAPAALGVLWSLRTSNSKHFTRFIAATIKEAAFAE